MAHNQFFMTGIGTSVGKTIASAALVSYWSADYWKPIQSGDLDQSDSLQVQQLASNPGRIWEERYRLKTACSPHHSAAIDEQEIQLADFNIPETDNNLIIEGAGGLFVPINGQDFMIDLIAKINLPVILCCRDYLGCINHSLLSIRALQNRNIPIAYLLLNGPFIPSSERIILGNLPENCGVIRIPELKSLTGEGMKSIIKQITIEKKK